MGFRFRGEGIGVVGLVCVGGWIREVEWELHGAASAQRSVESLLLGGWLGLRRRVEVEKVGVVALGDEVCCRLVGEAVAGCTGEA